MPRCLGFFCLFVCNLLYESKMEFALPFYFIFCFVLFLTLNTTYTPEQGLLWLTVWTAVAAEKKRKKGGGGIYVLDRGFIFVHIIILQLWKVCCHTRGASLANQSASFTGLYIHTGMCVNHVTYKGNGGRTRRRRTRRRNLIPSACKLYSDPFKWEISIF